MADPQGICTFPTLNRITTASFTLSHGITPSSAIVTVDFQAARPAAGGTLSFQFGRTRINFPDCRINTARGSYSQGRRIQYQIMDRRWKWHPDNGGGGVWGKYNEREPDKKEIKKKYRKSPQQLASILLDAMGESGYDVSRLPNSTHPEVDWIAANPAQELAKLCDSLACRIVLHLDNRVRIHRKGVGAKLPSAGALTHSYGIDPPERPDKITIVGEPTLFQSRIWLNAIGQDTDEKYKDVDQLSYRPTRGWHLEEPKYFPSLRKSKDALKLAKRDVFRLYEITESQADGSKKVPGYKGQEIKHGSELLPLGDGQIKFDKDPDGSLKARPAEVHGFFYDNIQDSETESIPTFKDVDEVSKWPGQFSVDAKLGHVRFSDPVYAHHGNTSAWFFPEIYIETSYSVTDQNQNQKVHYTKYRDMPGPKLGTGAKIVHVDGLQRTIIAEFKKDGKAVKSVDDSKEEFDREANYYLDQHAARYSNVETSDVTYAGILPLDLDGLRQQITWKVGGGPATTQASTNTEHNFAVPKYERRRERDILTELLSRATALLKSTKK